MLERLEGEETHRLLPPWRTLAGVAVSLQVVVWIGGYWLPQYLVNQGPTAAEALQIPHSYRILYPAYLKRDSEVFSTLPSNLQIPAGSRLEIFLEQGLPDGDPKVPIDQFRVNPNPFDGFLNNSAGARL